MTPFPFSKSPAFILPQSSPFYLSNFGYWDGESSYKTAGIRFIAEFAKGCELKSKSKILEVGSGLGGSLIYWSKYYHPKLLSAINLPGEQSDFAEHLFDSNKIIVKPFLKGSWEVLTMLPNSSYDYVFSLDAAYHFKNLPTFFKESYRVLKPGGRFVFTNFQLSENKFKKFVWLYLPFLIPKENLKLNEETILDLKSTGWKLIENQNWTQSVLKGFTHNSKDLPISLKVFAKILDWFVNYLGLTYYYYVFEK
ncbi:class I SAM-dependent methyltransferase [Leptospira sp. 2 VSF19]|uniref:Class I SAM-dependent methyltransferase n=1 Tax=Leptospira soteropolitanensis TaxID=2950025 RepID=A0AAW5VRR2_9LEPT|nr:class I SAM-dependent methyltransferase [Leptospira soteropolitanensis]MCW7494175.1 class I SAM-dependent methyltransferase [Leptospira soteropolitanensis]MCW7501850.1 class I SAM-dependent methyltransferase [Leptospira soteropolitanensis]MCW7524021.1 class I SAM-dependent methyltransferase [Leptospira soteropolitanensis]MCW7527886.1 class I SAM-dependent methyltransferase [Leptospira soteropolitanensis]MCW7531820.1 class I SAM-dependent methyltransferase [Leptospira soteropolitanensis]